MLAQREHKVRIDKAIWAEAKQLGASLQELGKRQGVPRPVEKLTAKTIDFGEAAIVEAAIVFLTEKKQTAAVGQVLNWIGIDKKMDDAEVFGGKTNGILGFGDKHKFRMHLFHFDHYPIQKLSDCKKAIKIVVYDRAFKPTYRNWDLALRILGMDPATILLIDITQDVVPRSKIAIPKVNALHMRALKLAEMEGSCKEVLLEKDLSQWIQIARLKNYLNYLDRVHSLTSADLEQKEKQLQGKSILIHKKQLESLDHNVELSPKEIGLIKGKMEDQHKQITRFVELKIENFDREQSDYKDLEEEITSFLGFVEEKGSRQLTLMISEGAIRDKLGKSHTILNNFFDQIAEDINARIEDIDREIMDGFKAWGLNTPEWPRQQFNQQFTAEVLNGSVGDLPDKPLEKKITSKGIGSLLMELRTPLFMLMPFMMIFALFAALVGGEDRGHIDESILFHENRPTIAIDQLPESRGNEFRRFIKQVEENRDPRKGVFDKEINGELVTEPQLATVTSETPLAFGNKVKIEETLEYHFDSKNQIIYLYLNENADRNFVIEKLYDPANGLLSIASSNRRGFGIGGLIRALSGLSDYRYLILIGLVSLVSWFIISRKGSMDAELKSAKNKERQKLNNDLRQYVDKSVKQSINKWRSKFVEVLGQRQDQMVKSMEMAVNRKMEQKRNEKLNDKKVLQKKIASIKTEKSKLTSLRTDYRKVQTKREQLETKVGRLLRA